MSAGERHVVVLGAGFGGLYAVRALDGVPARITVVDRRNYHLFQPLLYQVATAGLNPGDIARPIRAIVRHQKNVTVLLGEARSVDAARKVVVLADGAELAYDYLIVATGAGHSYFGHDDWERHAPGLKTIEDALEIRRRVLSAFELAERETDPERRAAWLTFVVVGGGPTGVEMAGALCEVARHALAHDFRRIDPKQARVILIEGVDRILPTFAPELSASARRQLERLGARVRTGLRVTKIDEHGVELGSEPRIEARTVVWAAGVAASPLARSLGVPLDRAGRVLVQPDLSIPGHPEVFVIGDLAALVQDGKPVPGVAPAAIQEGRHAARNVHDLLRWAPTEPFRYVDKGSLATIGRAAGIAEIKVLGRWTLALRGLVAWLAWLLIHILFLIGFRNRLLVLFEWAWAYVTFERGARLITDQEARRPPAR